MTIDTHGRSHQPAGSPASIGGQFAPAANPAAAAALPQTAALTAADLEHLASHRGAFVDGYTSEDVDRVLGPIQGYQLVVVWDEYDEGMMTGDSEIIGRHKTADGTPTGPWLRTSPELWDWLSGEVDSDRQFDASLPVLDADDEYEIQALDDCVTTGSNIAIEGELYDADHAFTQMVSAGYDPNVARDVADSSDSYDSAFEMIVLAEGR